LSTEVSTTVYKKARSFAAYAERVTAVRHDTRLHELLQNLSVVPQERRAVVERACRDLLGQPTNDGRPQFDIGPFIGQEMSRISDNDLPRYLFYRYRYEVYPSTREIDAYPPCVQIEPTSICNYRCVFCYQTDLKLTQGRHGHMGMMSLDTFKHIVDQIEGEVEAVTLASRGEPMMAKQIIPMLEYLSGKFLGLKINTNASLLTEAKAHAILAAEPNTLVFSADAADKELYGQLRVNGDLETVLANIRNFVEIKHRHYPQSRTITRVSGVKYSARQNFSEIELFWKDLADQVAFVDYNPWENPYDQPVNGLETPCSDLWRRAFVWWNGLVNPCDVDYRSTLAAGNILETSLSELWSGEHYSALRAAHLNGHRQVCSPCSSCVVV
jgi:sulfatase maturation enzyme AslB (radical SAM superfamily)